jgi:hypothetical protein
MDHIRHVGGNLARNDVHAVPVAVDQISRLKYRSSNFNGFAEFDYVGISVSHRYAAGEEGEPERFHGFQIPYRAVGDASRTLQRLGDSSVNFTHQRPECRRMVGVLEDHNPRLGQ